MQREPHWRRVACRAVRTDAGQRRPEHRARIRGDRRQRRRGCRPGGEGGAAGVRRRRVGPDDRGRARADADAAVGPDPGRMPASWPQLEARDTGKPKTAAAADITALARYFEYYGGAADKWHGETIPYSNGYLVARAARAARRDRAHPAVELPGADVRPHAGAVARGRATPSCSSRRRMPATRRSASASSSPRPGFPTGRVNIVTGRGAVAGAALAAHPGVDFVSFTGSPEVGQQVQKLAADHFIPCTLELGGKSPQVVFADADFDAAVPVICRAIIQNAGQTCSAGSRVLVERERLRAASSSGSARRSRGCARAAPRWTSTAARSSTASRRARVAGLHRPGARATASRCSREGAIADGVPAGGFFVAPALFGAVPREPSAGQRGSVRPGARGACRSRTKPTRSALANATDTGWSPAVWTRDGGRQLRVARRLRSGQVFVNSYGAGAGIELPFGGTRKSGHGREKGFMALHEFSRHQDRRHQSRLRDHVARLAGKTALITGAGQRVRRGHGPALRRRRGARRGGGHPRAIRPAGSPGRSARQRSRSRRTSSSARGGGAGGRRGRSTPSASRTSSSTTPA